MMSELPDEVSGDDLLRVIAQEMREYPFITQSHHDQMKAWADSLDALALEREENLLNACDP